MHHAGLREMKQAAERAEAEKQFRAMHQFAALGEAQQRLILMKHNLEATLGTNLEVPCDTVSIRQFTYKIERAAEAGMLTEPEHQKCDAILSRLLAAHRGEIDSSIPSAKISKSGALIRAIFSPPQPPVECKPLAELLNRDAD